VVDDFGVKYDRPHELEHFLGMTIDIDRARRTVSLSMPGYIEQAVNRYDPQHLVPQCNSPMMFVQPVYGSKRTQQATEDTSELLADPDRVRRIQQIVGAFLYYSRAVDPSMLPAVSKLSSRQSKPTVEVERDANRLLGYAKRYPNAQTVIRASGMILTGHSDASYLSETNARSRAGGILYQSQSRLQQKLSMAHYSCLAKKLRPFAKLFSILAIHSRLQK